MSQSGQLRVSMGSLRNAIGCRRQPVSGELSQSQVSMGSLRKTMEWVEASGADVETSLAPIAATSKLVRGKLSLSASRIELGIESYQLLSV